MFSHIHPPTLVTRQMANVTCVTFHSLSQNVTAKERHFVRMFTPQPCVTCHLSCVMSHVSLFF